MIKTISSVTKRDMNHWLSSPFDKGRNWIWRFDFGSDALGTNWRSRIPVTALLLVAIAAGKVKAEIRYQPAMLVGGFNLHLQRINGEIVSEDFDNLTITRKQLKREYLCTNS